MKHFHIKASKKDYIFFKYRSITIPRNGKQSSIHKDTTKDWEKLLYSDCYYSSMRPDR